MVKEILTNGPPAPIPDSKKFVKGVQTSYTVALPEDHEFETLNGGTVDFSLPVMIVQIRTPEGFDLKYHLDTNMVLHIERIKVSDKAAINAAGRAQFERELEKANKKLESL